MADEMKAQTTNKLAALIPQIMNAVGGGDARTAQMLDGQRQQNEQQVKQNNLKNFMRAVTSPDTGEITEQAIMKYAQLFNVAPQDAMKVIGEFDAFKKSRMPEKQQYTANLPGVGTQTATVRNPKTDMAGIPTENGMIYPGSITPAPEPDLIAVNDGHGGTVLRKKTLGLTSPANPQALSKVPDGKGGYRWERPQEGKGGMNNPTKGMRIETGPDGTLIQTNVADGGGLTRGAKTGVQKDLIEANATYSDMKATLGKYEEKFLKGKNKLGYSLDAFKEKWDIGQVTDSEKKDVEEYTAFRRDAISSLNNYIKQVTGAAMSELEAKRLMKAMPNPGIGMFDGDSPTQFKTKLDGVMQNLDRVIARNNYIQKHGLSSIEDVGLDSMDGIIDRRGEALEAELKAKGVPESEIEKAVMQALSEEFGVQF